MAVKKATLEAVTEWQSARLQLRAVYPATPPWGIVRTKDARLRRRLMARRGLTLLEVLIVISVTGVLVSLLLVGVQASRESGRRSECASHLRQIGIAVAAYESTHQVFPPGLSEGSFHVAILPFMEQGAIYDRLLERYRNGIYDAPSDLPSIPVWLCPSDGAIVFGNGGAGTNYVGNAGTWWPSDGWNGFFVYWVPISNEKVGPIRTSNMLDGMSNTIAVSETLRGDGSWNRLRVIWKVPKLPQDIDIAANQCRGIRPVPTQFGWTGFQSTRGIPWSDGNLPFTLYNHAGTPNEPSCYSSVYSGSYSAASNHRNGVNVAFADGHLAFVSDRIDIKVWRSLASRAGGEAP